MSDFEEPGAGADDAAMRAVQRLAVAIDELLDLAAPALSRDALLTLLKQVDRQGRRLAAAQFPLVAEVAERNLSAELGYRGSQQLLANLLTCTSRQASAKLDDAERFGPRRSITGQALAPAMPIAAAALGRGALAVDQGRVIAAAISAVPVGVREQYGPDIERSLTEHAREYDSRSLQLLAHRICAHLNPDGDPPADTEAQQHRQRSLSLARLTDSTGELLATLTPACQAIWESILTPLSRPRAADALGPDLRTPAQRWHDAFEEAGRLLLDSGKVPDQAGIHTTLVVTLSLRDLEQRIGVATTHNGGTLTVAEALRLAAGQQVIPAVLDDAGGIVSFGRRRRLASPGQRLALFARDRGCSFPGCGRSAAQSQVHHATDWTNLGPTDLDNLTLCCGYHNNEAPRQGWSTRMIDKVPYWIPPAWRDPTRTPIRNQVHHPERALDPSPDRSPDRPLGQPLDRSPDRTGK
jgi:hypothetical protein